MINTNMENNSNLTHRYPTTVSEFELAGLAKIGTFFLKTKDGENFTSKSNMTTDKFNALFDYCKDNWKDRKIAKVSHNGVRLSGVPINPLVIEVNEMDK